MYASWKKFVLYQYLCLINSMLMKKIRIFFIAVVSILMSLTAQAQNISVSGKVSDSQGYPVVGANVVLKGSATVYALTDVEGQFKLNVPSNGVLEVSCMGYISQDVAVAGKKSLTVVLSEDSELLDETIVVAFGTTTKEAFTGSATVLRSDELAKRQTTNVANALVGTVPGLQMRGASGAPGAGAGSMSIRGLSSISSSYANTEPLVIVDGSPYPASLSNIPQNDIESVTVLKDASSAALYGARGANGVILVTTKKSRQKEATVTVDMKWGSNSRAIQDYETITSPAEYYESFYALLNNYFINAAGYSPEKAFVSSNKNMINMLGYQVYTVPEGQYLIGQNGKLNPNATLGYQYTGANGITYYVQPDNWRDAAYKNSFRQEYTASVAGGTDKTSYYASVGYLGDNGIIEYSGYDRISARIKADYQAKKWLKIGANAAFVQTKQDSNPNMNADQFGSTNLMYYTSMIAPIYPIYVRVIDENGNPVIKTDERGQQQYDYGVSATNYYGLSRGFLQTGNPLGSNRYNLMRSEGNQFNGTFTADFTITPHLTANVTSNVVWGLSNYKTYDNPFYGPKVGVKGEISISNTNSLRTNNIQTITYNNTFGGLHNVNVLLGHEYYDQVTKYLKAKAQGGFSPDVKEINAFATKTDSESYTSEYNVEGFFASAQYNYNEKIYFSGSYRLDASSRFAKNHRWGSFWSVGGAWIMSKENWMTPTSSWLDLFKLKLSIGQQGNDSISNWQYVDLYSLSKADATTMAPSFYSLGNENITWQTTTNFNGGAEFSFLRGRISGEIEGYNRLTKDLLFWLSVPESNGVRGYYGNAGKLTNYGIEASFNFVPIQTRNVQWNIGLNLSHNKSKILELPESKTTQYGGFTERSMWYKVGGELNNYFTYAYAGVDPETGEALYYYDEDLSNYADPDNTANNTSKPGTKKSGTVKTTASASRYETGSTLPKLFGGFSTSVKLWDFELSANFDYQIGGKIFDTRYQYLMMPYNGSYLGQTYHKDWAKAWSPTNKSSNIPRWQYNDSYAASSSDRWLTDASYLNFSSFSVAYNIPVSKLGIGKVIGSAKVYVVGENLGFISARKGLDPRYSFDSTSAMNVYSPVRTISGGIKVTF